MAAAELVAQGLAAKRLRGSLIVLEASLAGGMRIGRVGLPSCVVGVPAFLGCCLVFLKEWGSAGASPYRF
jgi:hypothetical protein